MADRDVQLSMEAARPANEVATGKTIILFSDGTGNSSGKQQKTNVWRMYQAVDLGVPREAGQRIQIGRYDNGVGNSAFRLLAMVQGIFGWGLKRNILSLYLFLCRNYRKGDSICLFGFSRGAYTVRVLADLIDKQGVIPHERNGALDYLVRDAYRSYRRRLRPRMWPMRWLVPLWKWASSSLRTAARISPLGQRYDPSANHRPDIDFLGVWDTVGAYGGPILEVVRGIDDWIMPISFTDKKLPRCIKAARHALALDDERDSFQPLPWDETDESRERLQQVWFAGMHADVGGGYPDDSLAYVSLVWMLDEARACARMRFRPDREEDVRLQADGFGPIHDSRSGLAGYYRYQPRVISALMWPTGAGTESLVDPEQPQGQGMRRPALIHDSVFRRILSGTDRYAPLAIGRHFEIVADRSARRALPRADRERFSDPDWQRLQEAAQERVWDRVWLRRTLYFMTVLASLALPLSSELIRETGAETTGVLSHLVATPLRWIQELGLGSDRLQALIDYPWIPLVIAVTIAVLFRLSGKLEAGLRRICRDNWAAPIPPPGAEEAPRSVLCRFRIHWFYQDIVGFFRWTLLPAFSGVATLALLVAALFSAGTITRLTWNEGSDSFCPGEWQAARGAVWMATDNPCNRTDVRVTAGETYEVRLEVPAGQPWRDAWVGTDPRGRHAGNPLQLELDGLLVLMRRRPDARWMQPLAYIVHEKGSDRTSRTQPIEMADRIERRSDGATVFRGTFTALASGRLALAVNEAVLPWPFRRGFFYDGRLGDAGRAFPPRNSGGASVRVVRR